MKKVFAFITLFAMALSLLSGCGGGAGGPKLADEQVFRWNIGADPKTIDPTLNGASDGGNVIAQTFEGLVREQSGEVKPGIAESWTVSEDGLTITFKLRKSNWSDGSPLTAQDFIYGWKRGMDPKTASEYAYIWEYTNIKGVVDAIDTIQIKDPAEQAKAFEEAFSKVGISAPDDYTIVLELDIRNEYLISLLSFYHFMPIKKSAAESAEEGMWAKDPVTAVCNGPFKLASYEVGKGLRLVKNEHFWNKDVVKLAEIDGKFIDDNSTAYQAFQTGDLHYIGSVPIPEIPRLIAEDKQFHIFPLLGTYYFNFNLDLDIWKDARVRRALNLAIDRKTIVNTLSVGQVPALGFVPPGFRDANGKDFHEVAGNYGLVDDLSKLDEAKKLLAEAGYPDGKGFPTFTILYNTSQGHQTVAELVQEMLKTNLGINCKLENQEWAVFQDTRREGNFELARGGWLTDYMDPSGMLAIFTSENAYNDPNYNNPEFDEQMAVAAKVGGKAHFDALYKAQEIFMNDLPVIPVYHYTDYMLVKDNFQNWKRSVLGTMDFSEAYLTK